MAFASFSNFEKVICCEIKQGDETSYFVANLELFLQRAKVLDFLEKINKSEKSSCRRIDCAFVAPNEYDNIIEVLETKKVVFLIGDPEIGKTFTAARILWDYYLNGYHPRWYSGAEKHQREEIRKVLSEVRVDNFSVIYFEDPWGKKEFENHEELRRTISNIISQIQSLETRVVISSREEIFKDFKKENLSANDLSEFIIEMNLMKPSYSEEKKEQILRSWVFEFDCKWLNKLEVPVIKLASKKLVTPLSLWDFAASSKNITELSDLLELIDEKAKAVQASFAEEIAKMSTESILYLSLIVLLDGASCEVIIKTFKKLVLVLNVNKHSSNSFEALEKNFSSKVFLEHEDGDEDYYHFTHPSYEEGVLNSWKREEVKDFIIEILKLLKDDSAPFVRGICGLNIIKNMNYLPSEEIAQNLVLDILGDKNYNTRLGIALGLESSFSKLSSVLRLELLRLLLRDLNGEIRGRAISIVSNNYDKISDLEVINIINKALEDRSGSVRFEAVRCVEINFENFSKDLVSKALTTIKDLRNHTDYKISYL